MTDTPMATIRVGRIKATIWQNQDEKGNTYHATTLSRSYRDQNNEWKDTQSFSLDDLPRIRLATEKAFDLIHTKAQARAKADNGQMDLPDGDSERTPTSKKAPKRKFAKKVEGEREAVSKAKSR